MKSLFNGILCMSLLAFAVGCGKESKSGSKHPTSTLFNSGLTAVSTNVVQKLQTWYNSPTEGMPQIGPVNTQKQTRTYNTQPNCTQKSFLGIPYQYCTSNGTPTVNSTAFSVMIVQDGKAIKDKGNAELNAIFSGSLGTIVEAIDVGPSQSQITILRTDGTVVIYGINTARHSSLNPEYKSESNATQKVETIIL